MTYYRPPVPDSFFGGGDVSRVPPVPRGIYAPATVNGHEFNSRMRPSFSAFKVPDTWATC